MEEKADSENSYSDDSSSSSDSSSGSSECDEEVTEPVRILGHTLELPQELCEDYSIFKEFFSMKTWDSLEDKHKEYLREFLPQFPENDEDEKDTTLKMLFNFEPFHFKSPFNNFFSNLRQGNYRPDIARMRKFLMKARAKQQKHKTKSYYAKMLPEVLIARERLLATAKGGPPGAIPFLPLLPPKPSAKSNYKPLYVRARQRYFEELAAIWSEVGGEESEDDNYPEGPSENTFKKRKTMQSGQIGDTNVSGTLGITDPTHPASLDCLKNVLVTHRARRQYRENHPELNTTGITLDDIKLRVALVNGTKKLMFGGQKNDTPIQKVKKGTKKDKQKQENKSVAKRVKEENDSVENKPLLPNIKIKCEREESDSESSSFLDPVTSPRHAKRLSEHIDIKQEVPDISANCNDTDIERTIKQEPPDSSLLLLNQSRIVQPVPIKLEDLDGIDMMALPVELADDSGEVLQGDTSTENEETLLEADEALTEITHANFLSLVRALFPARAAHRASKRQLHARCAAAMTSPIAPLNTWYHLSEDWCAELNSALDFLAGERGPHPDDFVPYLQYLPDTEMYQWIGAGRDCDALLGRLSERWRRADAPRARPAPPPRYPSSWSVRQPTAPELADFRAQERRRFAAASEPFTYVQYDYLAAVGPAGGCGGGAGAGPGAAGAGPGAAGAGPGAAGAGPGAAGAGPGASLLAPGRPRAASLPALLRDALARLPNGEGSRRDIVVMLRMSQWIVPCGERALSGAVAGALERLLAVERDPVVEYDRRTALWTYLHRHRSEEDWNESVRRGRSDGGDASGRRVDSPQTPMDLDVAGVEEVCDNASDSDVDVDDTTSPGAGPQLSSAQLLMRATQATTRQAPANRPKGKLVATPQRPKSVPPKQQPKLPSLVQMKPAAKQPTATGAPKPAPKPTSVQSNPKTSLLTPNRPAAKTQVKQSSVGKVKQGAPSPKQGAKQGSVVQAMKQNVPPLTKQNSESSLTQASLPSIVVAPQRSPLVKQKSALETSQVSLNIPVQQTPSTVQSNVAPPLHHNSIGHSAKLTQVTRSLLIRPPAVHTTTSSAVCTTTQATASARRGVVRVLSPATPSSGKSLISPRALMQQSIPATKKRPTAPGTASVTTIAQSTANSTNVVSSIPTAVTSSVTTRTVQLAGGRTVQLAANQTVHLPSGQAVQLTSGHTLQLSSLQLPTHSVRLPSGQTVQLASPQAVQAVRAVSTAQVKNASPRVQPSSPTMKTVNQSVQIPVTTVQLGQTVQIAGQTVQLGGQSVQLTGHTVKLPSGQSVQVAGQGVLPSQSVQLPGGQTVQLASGGMQAVQLGQNVQLSGQTVQMPSGQSVQIGSQTVQIGGQTVQLAGGQTVHLPSGQTLQLSSGQTVQLSNGQTLQLATGQTLQLANQQTPKSITQVVRTQSTAEKSSQPIVAKLLTNAQYHSVESFQQTQLLSMERGRARGPRGARGVRVLAPASRVLAPASRVLAPASRVLAPAARVLAPASRVLAPASRVLAPAARLARPLLLTSKPLHNIILQQADGTIRVTSSGGTSTSQTIVLSNIGGQTVTTSSTTAPVLKLQQVNPIHQVKLPQGIKIQQSSASASSSVARGVLVDGQQLKLVGGRHVLARLIKPHPPP